MNLANMDETGDDRRARWNVRAMLTASVITATAALLAAGINAAASQEQKGAQPGLSSPTLTTPLPSSTPASPSPLTGTTVHTSSFPSTIWCKSNSRPVYNLKAATMYCEGPANVQIDFKVANAYVGSVKLEKDGNAYKNLDLCAIYKNVTGDGGPNIEFSSGNRKISEFQINVGVGAKQSCT